MINKTCPLIINYGYFYDFKSAYPRILKSIGYDIDFSEAETKLQRNILIGKEQKENSRLSSYLSKMIKDLVDFYISENNLNDDDIIVTQKDGFICRKKLEITDTFMKLDYRCTYDTVIITPDRNKYLATNGDEIIVKGLSYFYDELLTTYSKFCKLNFYNKSALFSQLQNIKDSVMDSQDINQFIITIDDKKLIQTPFATLEIKDNNYLSIKDIDKIKYFNHYFKEFLDSIFIEFY